MPPTVNGYRGMPPAGAFEVFVVRDKRDRGPGKGGYGQGRADESAYGNGGENGDGHGDEGGDDVTRVHPAKPRASLRWSGIADAFRTATTGIRPLSNIIVFPPIRQDKVRPAQIPCSGAERPN
jgi:hypothetical protein